MNGIAATARLTPLKKLIEVFVRAELSGQWVTVVVREDKLPKKFSSVELSDQIIAKLRGTALDGPTAICEVAGAPVEISRYMMGPGSETLLRMGLMTSRDMEGDLRDSVRAAIENNLKEKLLVEKRAGAITTLILDAREISLDERRVANSFAAVWPSVSTDDLDEIWIARTFDTTRFVPLKQGTLVYTGDEASWRWFHANCMNALTWRPNTPGAQTE